MLAGSGRDLRRRRLMPRDGRHDPADGRSPIRWHFMSPESFRCSFKSLDDSAQALLLSTRFEELPTMTRRQPGRPAGATRLHAKDTKTLAQIAALLVAEPGLKPTTAMRRLDIHDPSHTRRLQRHWRDRGSRLLQAARAEITRPTTQEIGIATITSALPQYVAQLEQALLRATSSPAFYGSNEASRAAGEP